MTMELSAFSELAGGLDHPEGIAPAPDGGLIAGGEAGQVYAIGMDGTVRERASTGGFLYGVVADGDGSVYACDFGRAEVARIAPTGEVSTFTRGAAEEPVRVPNFAAFGDGGDLYVTDSGDWAADDGVVFRVSASGDATVWSREVPRFPNGCCVSADGTWLLVVESHGRCVSRIPIRHDGSAGTPEPVVELPGSQPDGIALAVDGTLYVGCYRPDRIYRVPPGSEPEILAEDPDGVVLNQPTNVAFVGPARDRLAVASLGGWSIMAADVGDVGLPLRYPTAG
jgi:gluconolactonase